MKDVFSVIGMIVFAVALIVGGAFGSLAMYRYFAPRWEGARTDVYRNTKSYTEGTTRDLRQLQREYEAADAGHKTALRTIILQRSDEVDRDKMPSDVRRFIESVQ